MKQFTFLVLVFTQVVFGLDSLECPRLSHLNDLGFELHYLSVGEPKREVEGMKPEDFSGYATKAIKLMEGEAYKINETAFGKVIGKSLPKPIYNRLWQMRLFEHALAFKDKAFKMPAWNYLKYYKNYSKDPALSPKYFGQGLDGCVKEGAFKTYKPIGEKCYRRNNLALANITLYTEKELFASANLRSFVDKLTRNSVQLWYAFWRDYKQGYADPIKFSMAAHDWNLLIKYGKINNVNIDVDFGGKNYLGSNKTIYVNNYKIFNRTKPLCYFYSTPLEG